MSQINVDIIRSRTGTAATCDKGLVVSGVTTSTSFTGDVVGNVTGNVTGNATGLSGTPDIVVQNITGVGATFTGTVSYENIQNLDSVGIVTARGGLNVGALTGIAATIDTKGDAQLNNISAGIITATNFDGVITGVDVSSGGSFLGAGITAINWDSGATVSASGAGATITISAGVSTEAVTASAGTDANINVGSYQDHKVTATGICTITCQGTATEGNSHTMRIVNSGIATVGFSSYFLWPGGSVPTLSTGDGEISMISFTVQRSSGGTGIATQLLSGASINYS
tara:strand:+ start:2011 stop:2862 length:852 start_codon:yes stop_codon:yes gene_type:complete